MIGTLIAKRAVAGAFDALNRHDLEGFMAGWSDDAVFIYPGDVPASGTFQGKSAIASWFEHFFKQFPQIEFKIGDICVQSCFDLAGNNVLAVQWSQRVTNRDGRAGSNSGVTVVTIKGSKVIAVQDYYFDTGAEFQLDWGVGSQ
jgi:ketosteroid isomerase-like protein